MAASVGKAIAENGGGGILYIMFLTGESDISDELATDVTTTNHFPRGLYVPIRGFQTIDPRRMARDKKRCSGRH